MSEIVKLARRGSPYASSFALEEIDVEFADGSDLRLVMKDLSPARIHETTVLSRPDFLYEPQRDIDMYRDVLPHAPSGTPRWYGGVSDAVTRQYLLFLERVDGLQLTDVSAFSTWERTARWIGEFHRSFSPYAIARLAKSSRLLVYDEAFYWRWITRAQQFAHSSKASQVLNRIARAYPPVVDRLLRLPRTVLHGDFYPCNVVIGTRGDQVRICPVDWELAAIGPGLIDLASLITGWTARQQRALLSAYRAAADDGEPKSAAASKDWTVDLDCCRLHLAIRMLGWSATWTPPPQHARKWLDEAEKLADRLLL